MAKPQSKWGPTLAAARKHIIAQGEVIYAHNLVHDEFFKTFLIALSLERGDEFGADVRFYDHAMAIWHTSQSDSQQRKMALAAISTVPAKKIKLKAMVQRLEWARKRTDKLAEYRNLLAHNPVTFRGMPKGKMIISVPQFGGYATKSRDRLAQIKTLAFWATLRTDCLKLSEYLRAVNFFVLAEDYRTRRGAELIGAPKTLPDRPRLRSLRLMRQIDHALTMATHAPKQHRRRRSSRASP